MAFRVRRQSRYDRLRAAGLEPFEARALSAIPFARAPFIRDMVRERQTLLRGLQKEREFNNWSKTRYIKEKRRLISFEYKDKGLVFTQFRKGIIRIKGRPDPWQMFRYYRDEAIAAGEWEETPRRRKKKKSFDEKGIRIDKGDVARQKAKRVERQRAKRDRER